MRKSIAWAVVYLVAAVGLVGCGGGGGGGSYMSLSQTGTSVTGQGYCVDSWDGVTIAGSISGNSLSLQGTFGANTYPFSGTVNGSSIQQGTFNRAPLAISCMQPPV